MYVQNQPNSLDEAALVMAASKGDLDAFNQLVLTHQDMIYNHVYSFLGDPDVADDVVQDSFLRECFLN